MNRLNKFKFNENYDATYIKGVYEFYSTQSEMKIAIWDGPSMKFSVVDPVFDSIYTMTGTYTLDDVQEFLNY